MAYVADPWQFVMGLALFLLPGAMASFRFLAAHRLAARIVAIPVLGFTIMPATIFVLHLLLFVPLTLESFATLAALLSVALAVIGGTIRISSPVDDEHPATP